MTNYEKIKQMTVEEMAEFFTENKINCFYTVREGKRPCLVSGPVCTPEECFKQWLLQEVEE